MPPPSVCLSPAVPLFAILIGIVLNRLWPLELLSALPAPAAYWMGGTILVGAILGLGLYSVILVRRSGQSENPWKPTTEILERGPFRMSRNPMYLQMILGCVGFAMVLRNTWILLLVPMCAWVLHRFAIMPEEAYLERKFGEQYLAYKRRVRRWI